MASAISYPAVDPKSPGYSGIASIAIVKFRGQYASRVDISAEQLRARLAEDSRILGPDFKVLKHCDDKPMPAAFVEVQRAIAGLQAGKKVDLEHLLDNY